MQRSVDARRFSRASLAVSATMLAFIALVARLAVHHGDRFYSGSEFDAWLTLVTAATACFLAVGLGLVRLPVGRGVLLGTALAVAAIACAVMIGAFVSVTTGPY